MRMCGPYDAERGGIGRALRDKVGGGRGEEVFSRGNRPAVWTGCSTCFHVFRHNLPSIKNLIWGRES